jgi:hypothetical protein
MAKTPTDIRSLARSHTAKAIRVLAGIVNAGRAPAAARVSAAIALLDRGWGKPEQYHEVRQKVPDQMTDAELNVEIARVAALLGLSESQEAPTTDPIDLN